MHASSLAYCFFFLLLFFSSFFLLFFFLFCCYCLLLVDLVVVLPSPKSCPTYSDKQLLNLVPLVYESCDPCCLQTRQGHAQQAGLAMANSAAKVSGCRVLVDCHFRVVCECVLLYG